MVHVSLVAKGGAIQHAQADVVEDVAVIVEEIVQDIVYRIVEVTVQALAKVYV